MDVNAADWDQREFKLLADFCEDKDGSVLCDKTGYACKDYLCPKVKAAQNIKELRANFA